MEMQFRHLDRSIESQPMPEQFQDTKAWVYCNDCSAKSEVKYHWLGLKCAVCDSYNTAQISIIGNPRSLPGIGVQIDGNSQIPDDVDLLLPEAVQAFSRGRTSGRNSLIRRPATSATALDALRTRPSEVRQRDARSASPPVSSWTVVSDGNARALVNTDAMDMDDGDEEDDVDFWGGESPRERALLAERRTRDAAKIDDSDDDSDDSDEIMEDESEEDDDDDHMDIFGHR
ncbi:hypothetical protein MMC32_002183 [Xylographa parallela]|nr:hypothetical protein [Xylographa parallela]